MEITTSAVLAARLASAQVSVDHGSCAIEVVGHGRVLLNESSVCHSPKLARLQDDLLDATSTFGLFLLRLLGKGLSLGLGHPAAAFLISFAMMMVVVSQGPLLAEFAVASLTTADIFGEVCMAGGLLFSVLFHLCFMLSL